MVVPVRDRPELLQRVLTALNGMTCLVVDDASREPRHTKEIVDRAGGRFLALATNAGPGGARNAGLGQVTTPLVAFVDSDCVPGPNWLEPLLGHFDDPMVAAVAPRIVPFPVVPATALSRYEEVRSSLDRGGTGGLVRPLSRIPYVPSATLLVRRAVAGSHLFDPRLRGGEDVDLVWRLVDAGWDVRYEPASIVQHDGPAHVGPWLGRRAFYGTTAGPLARRHPASLVPLQASAWSAGVWALACARRPVLAAGLLAASVGVLARRFEGLVEKPIPVAAKIAGAGTLRAALPALHGLTRAWSPVLVLGLCWPRTRRAAALALVAPALRRLADRPDGPRPAALHRTARGRRPRLRLRCLAGLRDGADPCAAPPAPRVQGPRLVQHIVAHTTQAPRGRRPSREDRRRAGPNVSGSRSEVGPARGTDQKLHERVAMSNEWFETVLEAQRRAKKRLPKSVYAALVAGSEKGITVEDNIAAYGELGFAPHVAGSPASRDLSTTVMGQSISFPVLISPTGVQAVHPDGEVAVARAAAARGTAMGLSSFASKPVEDVVAANPQTFFQVYWVGTRDDVLERIERARAAGAVGLIATLDWSFSHGRDWGSPVIPETLDLKSMARFAPEALSRPRWLYDFAKSGQLPDLTAPNMGKKGETGPTFFGAYGAWMQTPPPSWEDVAWLRQQWEGAFMLKGVSRIDDAKRAVDAGVTAISVSNHGGNNLDGTPATIRALQPIAQTVGDQIEVLLDGGIRRGSDVVKALALGARSVMIGRAYLWGLAANGQAGVENVLDILRSGIESALLGLGHASIHDLTPDDLIIPPGFSRRLGANP